MLIRSNVDVWEEYVRHDFVEQLGRGTLSRESFIHFLKCATTVVDGLLSFYSQIPPFHRQDYLYLKYYARAHGYGSSVSMGSNRFRHVR